MQQVGISHAALIEHIYSLLATGYVPLEVGQSPAGKSQSFFLLRDGFVNFGRIDGVLIRHTSKNAGSALLLKPSSAECSAGGGKEGTHTL